MPEIREAYTRLKQGEPMRWVCKDLGCHVNTLKRAMRLKGLILDPAWKKRFTELSAWQANKTKQMATNGASNDQMAETLQLPWERVREHFKAHGGRPPINVKLTSAETGELVRLLKAGWNKKALADKFLTCEYFIRLMIVKLGVHGYFLKYPPPSLVGAYHFNSPTEDVVIKYIDLNFKGGKNAEIVKQLGTSRPTMDKILNRIEADYMEGL